MTAQELYALLDKAGIDYEVADAMLKAREQ